MRPLVNASGVGCGCHGLAQRNEQTLDSDSVASAASKRLATIRARAALLGFEVHELGDAWPVVHHASGRKVLVARSLSALAGAVDLLHDAADARRRLAMLLARCTGTGINADAAALNANEIQGVEAYLIRIAAGRVR